MIGRGAAWTVAAGAAAPGVIATLAATSLYGPGTPSRTVAVDGPVQGGGAGVTALRGAGAHATGARGAGAGAAGDGAATRGGSGAGGAGVPAGVQLPSQGVNGGVIHLGAIVTQTGPGRSTTMAHALVAWEKSVNAAGGIDGYQVQIDIRDDQGNPDLGASEYRQLWEVEKVFAFVGECAPLTDEQMVSYVQQNDVPLVGECQSSPDAYAPPSDPSQCYCVWVGGPTPTQNGALGALLMQRLEGWPSSGNQVALVCLDDPTTIQDCDGAAQRYGSGGLWNGGPQMEQIYDNNYSQLIAQWQSQGITHVHLVLDPGSIDRYLQAAQGAGYSAQVFDNTVVDAGTAGPGGYQNANGMMIGTPWTPLDQSTPGMQRLRAAMSTYYPDDQVDLYAQTAWISCLIFEHALQLMGRDVSEARLISTLDGIHGWDTGMGPVEDYSPGNHVGPFESALMKVVGAGTSGWRLVTVHGAVSG